MEEKEGFVIYKRFYEPVKILSDEQLGKLFRAIFEYQISGNENVENDIRIAFEFFKNQFALDNQKYQKIVERNRENGKKGGRPKQNPKNPVGLEKPKKADKEKDKDKDKDIKKENIKRKKFIKPTLAEVKEYCVERNNTINPVTFINYYESNGWMVGKNPMKDWKACIRSWETKDYNKKPQEEKLPEWFNKRIEKQEDKESSMELEEMLKEFE